MNYPDFINGLFEFVGGLLIAFSCVRLYKDKAVKGVSLWPVVFFNSWGFWNLAFYPVPKLLVEFSRRNQHRQHQHRLGRTNYLLQVAVQTTKKILFSP
jgi:hypothetical protein